MGSLQNGEQIGQNCVLDSEVLLGQYRPQSRHSEPHAPYIVIGCCHLILPF
jgi:hypothetical protein